jgi:hypothetical protein
MALIQILTLVAAMSSSPADIDAKIAAVLPTAEENRWLEIPWRLNLGVARREAAESKKPLFVWMMNGHPMGCT